MPVARIALHLTERCQRRCAHCFRDPDPAARDLPCRSSRILDQARRVYGVAHVGLTGGEPTLHPELSRVLDAIVERNMTWNVTTNGDRFQRLLTLLEEEPRRRDALSQVSISLDGADEATHDQLRGPGSYREATTAASLCARARIPFSLRMTVNGLNVDQIEPVGLAAERLGASRVVFGATFPTGTSRDPDLYLSVADLVRAQERILALRDVLRIRRLERGLPARPVRHVRLLACGR
jgi:MoaA/NifB/PqqE/SkfB family radical SAM enzyme